MLHNFPKKKYRELPRHAIPSTISVPINTTHFKCFTTVPYYKDMNGFIFFLIKTPRATIFWGQNACNPRHQSTQHS